MYTWRTLQLQKQEWIQAPAWLNTLMTPWNAFNVICKSRKALIIKGPTFMIFSYVKLCWHNTTYIRMPKVSSCIAINSRKSPTFDPWNIFIAMSGQISYLYIVLYILYKVFLHIVLSTDYKCLVATIFPDEIFYWK